MQEAGESTEGPPVTNASAQAGIARTALIFFRASLHLKDRPHRSTPTAERHSPPEPGGIHSKPATTIRNTTIMSASTTVATSTTSPLPRVGLARASRGRTPLDTLRLNQDIDRHQFEAGKQFSRDWLNAFGSMALSDPTRIYVDASRQTGADDHRGRAFTSWQEACAVLDGADRRQFGGKAPSDLLTAVLIDELTWAVISRDVVDGALTDKKVKATVCKMLGELLNHYHSRNNKA
jgi:hypothetical protein